MPWLPESKPKTARSYTRRKYDEDGNNLYKTERWISFSRRFKQTHCLCVGCLCYGRVTLPDYTDHVFPWRGDPTRFWNNLFQPLCSRCHGHKRGQELKDRYHYYVDTKHYVFNDKDYIFWNEIAYQTIDPAFMRVHLK